MHARLVLPLFLILLSACTSTPGTGGSRLSRSEQRLHTEISLHLTAAEQASKKLQSNQQTYNQAVATLVNTLLQLRPVSEWQNPIQITDGSTRWEIRFDSQSNGILPEKQAPFWSPALFDNLLDADSVKLNGLSQPILRSGLGNPVVLVSDNPKSTLPDRSYRSATSIYVPATALLSFEPDEPAQGTKVVRLRLADTSEPKQHRVGSRSYPVASNLSAAIALTLTDPTTTRHKLRGLFRPDSQKDLIGLFALQPYEKSKIPVIFVHGLRSSPQIWINPVNAIYADPELSKKFLPILFIYPTGLSIPDSASRLRRNLQEYRNHWDPEHQADNLNNSIIIGHSMGGLLSRMQVIDSGEDFRRAFFTRPPDAIPWLSSNQQQRISQALYFKPQPFIKRAVFIATPHQGSQIADWAIVNFFSRLIRLPSDLFNVAEMFLTQDHQALNPALLDFNHLGLRSVDMLSPSHPFFGALNARPIGVPHHSIIGDRGKGDQPGGGDGAVPYTSAHLPSADSELIIPYPHSCCHTEAVTQEILRILRLHPKNR